MMQFVIYPQESGSVALVMPASECELPIEEIARKDVPAGVPFLIVSTDQLPADHTFFNAWEADFSSPHGYGIGADAWFAEQGATTK